MKVNTTPFPTIDNNWNYGFNILILPQTSEEVPGYTKEIEEFIDKVLDASVVYGHSVDFNYKVEDNKMTISARANYTSTEKQVHLRLGEGGLSFPVLMTPIEQDQFLNENRINQKIIDRIYDPNSNPESTKMSKNSFEKCLKKLYTIIEE